MWTKIVGLDEDGIARAATSDVDFLDANDEGGARPCVIGRSYT